jgi:phenylacetate-CoA ligase
MRIFVNIYNFILFVIFHLVPINILNYLTTACSLPPSLTSKINPSLLEYLGEKKALFIFRKTCKLVPGYTRFLNTNNISPQDVHNINDYTILIPPTTKDNYIRKYKLKDRCIKGKIPKNGYLEESAGTSGQFTNWIRSMQEEMAYCSLMKSTMTYLYNINKSQKYIVLNGFMLGCWAGGQRFASRIGPLGIVKNIGMNTQKIIQSIKTLGFEQHYIIGGYPPFLKELIERGKKTEGFDWKRYHVHLFTGGEGFVEEWRDYIASELKDGAMIYSSYGATDLEVGIAVETPFSIAIRKILNKDNTLRIDLLATNRIPCFLGQYSPAHFYIGESKNDNGIKELEITVLNQKLISPKIKYNIGDEGGIIKFNTMCHILEERGYSISKIGSHSNKFPILPIPFLYLFGRSDGTVTINGAIISPSDIYKAIFSNNELISKINTFKLSVETDTDKSIRLFIYIEAQKGIEISDSLKKSINDIILSNIVESNECFRLSWEKNPEAAQPIVKIIPFRTGIFADAGEYLKYRYVKR